MKSIEDLDETEIEEFNYEFNINVDDRTYRARQYINRYFMDKEHYHGGPISPDLISDRYLDIFFDTENIEGQIEAIYAALEDVFAGIEQTTISNDIQYVLSLLHLCAKAEIPRDYAFAIMIMHLELCEGISVSI